MDNVNKNAEKFIQALEGKTAATGEEIKQLIESAKKILKNNHELMSQLAASESKVIDLEEKLGAAKRDLEDLRTRFKNDELDRIIREMSGGGGVLVQDPRQEVMVLQ